MAGAASAADMVVIQSSGASVNPGDVISDSAPLSLASGASVTLLTAAGQTLNLTGPFNGVPEAQSTGGDSAIASAISNMLKGQRKSTASLGAIRSGSTSEAEATVPSPWLISVESSGDRCIYSDRAILYRGDNAEEATLSLTGGVKSIRGAKWPAGAAEVALSNDTFADGGVYTATLGERSVELTMHKASTAMNNPAELAAWMAQKGCVSQALALLNGLN
ncbi:MAG: hypothetical protein AAF684_07105 [Pseudomonadota bacterium]